MSRSQVYAVNNLVSANSTALILRTTIVSAKEPSVVESKKYMTLDNAISELISRTNSESQKKQVTYSIINFSKTYVKRTKNSNITMTNSTS